MLPETARGELRGTYDLWLEDPTTAERSDGAARVSPERLEYTWSFRGKPQRGVIDLRAEDGVVRAEWTDTWHSPKPMICTGRADGGRIVVTGSYPAGDGSPDWGWRTELEPTADGIIVRMFNVTPAGEESRAVEMIVSRRQ